MASMAAPLEAADAKKQKHPNDDERKLSGQCPLILLGICNELFHKDIMNFGKVCKRLHYFTRTFNEKYVKTHRFCGKEEIAAADKEKAPVGLPLNQLRNYEIESFELFRDAISEEDMLQLEEIHLRKVNVLTVLLTFPETVSADEKVKYYAKLYDVKIDDTFKGFMVDMPNPTVDQIIPFRIDIVCRITELIAKWKVEKIVIKMGSNENVANLFVMNHPDKISHISLWSVNDRFTWLLEVPKLPRLEIFQLRHCHLDLSHIYNHYLKKWNSTDHYKMPAFQVTHFNRFNVKNFFIGIDPGYWRKSGHQYHLLKKQPNCETKIMVALQRGYFGAITVSMGESPRVFVGRERRRSI